MDRGRTPSRQSGEGVTMTPVTAPRRRWPADAPQAREDSMSAGSTDSSRTPTGPFRTSASARKSFGGNHNNSPPPFCPLCTPRWPTRRRTGGDRRCTVRRNVPSGRRGTVLEAQAEAWGTTTDDLWSQLSEKPPRSTTRRPRNEDDCSEETVLRRSDEPPPGRPSSAGDSPADQFLENLFDEEDHR